MLQFHFHFSVHAVNSFLFFLFFLKYIIDEIKLIVTPATIARLNPNASKLEVKGSMNKTKAVTKKIDARIGKDFL